MQLYGLSANEALKLTDAQVNTMLEHADNVAASLVTNNASFQAALTQRLAPVKRIVRASLDTDASADTTTASTTVSSGGGPVGPPPSF